MASVEGYTRRGDYVRTVRLVAPDGMTASVLTLGGRVVDLRMPSGRQLTLPLASVREVEDDGAYIGVAVGRTANRIRAGRLRLGRTVSDLERNDNQVNHIHGGRHAWDKRLFSVRSRGPNWVQLYLFSPEGDQGYPSAVDVWVRYALDPGGALRVDLSTRNVGDVDTITNMTSHMYLDLSGHGGTRTDAALRWTLRAPGCGRYLPLDPTAVPTGAVETVEGTRYDFREAREIAGQYDNFFIRDGDEPEEDRGEALLCEVRGAGVRLEVSSNQPGFQLYTSNGFDGGECEPRRPPLSGFARCGSIAIEPSAYLDAGNHSNFPTISLPPGKERTQTIVYKFVEE